MFITVRQLAEKVNNKKRIDINNWKVVEINVILSQNGHKLDYIVTSENGLLERYTDQNVPDSIIRLINKYNPVRTAETETDKTFYYRFV